MIAGTGAAETEGNASRRASVIAVAVLCIVLVARLAGAFASDEGDQAPFIMALFVLPLLYAVPGTRPLLARYTWPLLAAQAALTYVPFAVFGGQWAQGVAGLLAGMVLLTLPGRLSWPLAGVLLVADVAVRAGLVGLPWAPAWSAVLWLVIVFVDDCVAFFGPVRLSDLVAELQSARGRFAELAVAHERLQAAEDLQAAVGGRLADVTGMTAAAQQALPGNPAEARAQMEAAGVAARDAIAQARAVTADHRTAPSPEPATAATGADIAPRLAWTILVVILCGFGLQTANNIYLAHLDPRGAAALLASVAVCVALQLYHSRHAPEGRPPRAWPLTLALQTVLVYMPFLLLRGYVGSLAGFAAGSFLLLVPGRWRWAGYAAVVASWSALYATVPQAGAAAATGMGRRAVRDGCHRGSRPAGVRAGLAGRDSPPAGDAARRAGQDGGAGRTAARSAGRPRPARPGPVRDRAEGRPGRAADRPGRHQGKSRDRGDDPDLRPCPRGHPAGRRSQPASAAGRRARRRPGHPGLGRRERRAPTSVPGRGRPRRTPCWRQCCARP